MGKYCQLLINKTCCSREIYSIHEKQRLATVLQDELQKKTPDTDILKWIFHMKTL